MRIKTTIVAGAAVLVGVLTTAGSCDTDATVVSENISLDADMFKVERRIVFFNGITDTYLLTIEGRCSIEDEGNQLEVTCKIAEPDKTASYKKHFLGLDDNVSYFVEQTTAIKSDPYHYKVVFKPEVLIPDIDLRTSGGDGQ